MGGEEARGSPAVSAAVRGRRSPGLKLDLPQDSQRNMTRILGFLYLGGDAALCDKAFLRELRVCTIINCTETCPNFFPEDFNHIRVPVPDTPNALLLPHLQPALRAIEEARRQGGTVVVHCKAGVSRSPAVVLAFLVQFCGMSLLEALEFTRSRRPQVSPNSGFISQLVRLEATLRHGRVTLDAEKYAMDRFSAPVPSPGSPPPATVATLGSRNKEQQQLVGW